MVALVLRAGGGLAGGRGW